MDPFIEDDAAKMIGIVETVFQRLAFDYLLTDAEAARVAREFASGNLPQTLRTMHAATDRLAFANALLLPLVVQQVKNRKRVALRLES